MARRRLRLRDKSSPYRKSQQILILLQTPHTLADNCPFQDTGHCDQPFDVCQIQTHSQWTREHCIILGEAEFFSRDLTDQREPIGGNLSQQPDIFEIDRRFIDTKPARSPALKKPSASSAFSVSALLFTLHKPSPYLLEMLVGFIAG